MTTQNEYGLTPHMVEFGRLLTSTLDKQIGWYHPYINDENIEKGEIQVDGYINVQVLYETMFNFFEQCFVTD